MSGDLPREDPTIALVVDRLDPLPVTVRPLFGGHSLYLGDKLPAFIMDGTLCVKITDFTDERLTDELKGEAYPGSKPYWRLPGELLEDRDWLRLVISETAERIAPPVRRARKARK